MYQHELLFIYTDGQKKRYSKILSCIACGSQTRAAQAYHDQNLESSLGVILICLFCLPGMLANIHVYILTAVTIFFLLSNLSQIFNVALLLHVSIIVHSGWSLA